MVSETHLTTNTLERPRKLFKKRGWKTYVCPATTTSAKGCNGGILIGACADLHTHAVGMGAKHQFQPFVGGYQSTSCVIRTKQTDILLMCAYFNSGEGWPPTNGRILREIAAHIKTLRLLYIWGSGADFKIGTSGTLQ